MNRIKHTALMTIALLLTLAIGVSASQSKTKRSAKSTKAKTTTKPAKTTATEAKPAEPQEVERITVDELKEKLAKNEPVFIIDSRSQGSYESSDAKIKGAVRIPADEVEARLKEIPRDKEIAVYCT